MQAQLAGGGTKWSGGSTGETEVGVFAGVGTEVGLRAAQKTPANGAWQPVAAIAGVGTFVAEHLASVAAVLPTAPQPFYGPYPPTSTRRTPSPPMQADAAYISMLATSRSDPVPYGSHARRRSLNLEHQLKLQCEKYPSSKARSRESDVSSASSHPRPRPSGSSSLQQSGTWHGEPCSRAGSR